MNKFLEAALIILALIIGAWLWRHFIEKPHITSTISWYERPVSIPPKTVSQSGKTIKPLPSSETVRRDSIIAASPCDSLRALADSILQPFTIFSIDTVAASDSLGGFSAIELLQIEADPWSRIISFTRSYQDAVLRLSRENTIETRTEINWYISLGALIIGMLVSIFLLR